MSALLFINACVRGEASRTLKLANCFLSEYKKHHPGVCIEKVSLALNSLKPMDTALLETRNQLYSSHHLEHPLFAPARQFAEADSIVVAAPFWDLSYPAVLRIYLEHVTVPAITFGYDAGGRNIGLCRAKKLLFVTTRGGNFSAPETEMMECGARHLAALCRMYGIPQFKLLCAEGLDDVRLDSNAILNEALKRASAMAITF